METATFPLVSVIIAIPDNKSAPVIVVAAPVTTTCLVSIWPWTKLVTPSRYSNSSAVTLLETATFPLISVIKAIPDIKSAPVIVVAAPVITTCLVSIWPWIKLVTPSRYSNSSAVTLLETATFPLISVIIAIPDTRSTPVMVVAAPVITTCLVSIWPWTKLVTPSKYSNSSAVTLVETATFPLISVIIAIPDIRSAPVIVVAAPVTTTCLVSIWGCISDVTPVR